MLEYGPSRPSAIAWEGNTIAKRPKRKEIGGWQCQVQLGDGYECVRRAERDSSRCRRVAPIYKELDVKLNLPCVLRKVWLKSNSFFPLRLVSQIVLSALAALTGTDGWQRQGQLGDVDNGDSHLLKVVTFQFGSVKRNLAMGDNTKRDHGTIIDLPSFCRLSHNRQ